MKKVVMADAKVIVIGTRSLKDLTSDPDKARIIAAFKRAGFVEHTCGCGSWYMCHPADDKGKCPKCLTPHLNN